MVCVHPAEWTMRLRSVSDNVGPKSPDHSSSRLGQAKQTKTVAAYIPSAFS
jgi:hypothetical protein